MNQTLPSCTIIWSLLNLLRNYLLSKYLSQPRRVTIGPLDSQLLHHFCKASFIIVLPFELRFLKRLHMMFFNQNCMYVYCFSRHWYKYPAHLICYDLVKVAKKCSVLKFLVSFCTCLKISFTLAVHSCVQTKCSYGSLGITCKDLTFRSGTLAQLTGD